MDIADAPSHGWKTSTQSVEHFNVVGLCERCLNDLNLVASVLDKFEGQAARDLEAITRAVLEGDDCKTAQRAHTLKGAASLLCAKRLARIAGVLERSAHVGNMDRARRCLEYLQSEIRQCIAGLPALRQVVGVDKYQGL